MKSQNLTVHGSTDNVQMIMHYTIIYRGNHIMFQPYNIEHAKEFESISKHIMEQWNKLPQMDQARERLLNSEFYHTAAHAQYILETLDKCDRDNYDYFMEKSVC